MILCSDRESIGGEMKEKILPCPFCGSKDIEINKVTRCYGLDCDDLVYYVAECKLCGCRHTENVVDSFRKFTKYAIEDLRKDPSLEAQAHDEYYDYLERVRSETIQLWNTRVSVKI